MTEKTLTTENIKPALDALRGELAPWPVVAKKQDRLNTAQLNAANSGITSSLVAQIIANTAAIRALESAITGTGLRALVVASLPAVGTQGILYIVPVTTYDPTTDADVVNYSNEYIWIVAPDAPVTEGYYEQVGQTGIVINNGQLTITVNGTSVGTFTANQSVDTTAAITVPTNADYVDLTTDQTVAGVKTFSSTIEGTASKAIADEDGTSIKTGYVNVAGNQTVTGDKSFTGSNTFNNILPNATNTYALGSSSYQWSSVYAQTYYYNGTAWGLDKANVWSASNTFNQAVISNSSFWITSADLQAKNQSTLISARLNKIGNESSDGKAFQKIEMRVDATYTDTAYCVNYYNTSGNIAYDFVIRQRVDNQGTKQFYPSVSGVAELGTSTNQWKSVYAQSYYYNGTQWGLDRNNTWTGINTFSSTIYSKIDATTLASYKDIYQCQNDSGNRVVTFRVTHSTASRSLSINVHDNSNSAPKGIVISNDGNNNISLTGGGASNDLGTSTNKWKTLNGINPGALSLPDYDSTAKVDISGSIIPDQYGNIYYTPTINGWLYVCFNVSSATTTDSIFYIQAKDNNVANSNFVQTSWMPASSSTSSIAIFFPVIANKRFIMQINFSNYTIIKAHVIPCLGNV